LHPVAEKIVSNVLNAQQIQKEKLIEKENQSLSCTTTSIETNLTSDSKPEVGETEEKSEQVSQTQLKNEVKQQTEDKNFKNEQTGLKIEISHDEDQHIDYSDEDEDEEEDLSDKENHESEKK
jgi:hypothetical protein